MDLKDRIDTFTSQWTHLQPPLLMAQAGFYYAEILDFVHCFYCGLILWCWTPTDNPFKEHLLYANNCTFIQVNQHKIHTSPTPTDITSEESLCKLCYSEPISLVYLPCRHLLSCSTCSFSLRKYNCPKCRTPIQYIIQVYSS